MAKLKSIRELKKTWEIEKETFRNKELGGLQGFVENILLCGELFALKQGYESTKIQDRKNEITRETRNKEGGKGRADFVIYINGDNIVIPVEVEAYKNIKSGESQILQYQTDWRKKYGILTDGNEWRLYFDRWYETFYLADIPRILHNYSTICYNKPNEFFGMRGLFWEKIRQENNIFISFKGLSKRQSVKLVRQMTWNGG